MAGLHTEPNPPSTNHQVSGAGVIVSILINGPGSTSYGDDEQTGQWTVKPLQQRSIDCWCFAVPESYARRVCAGFAQLGEMFGRIAHESKI